MTLDTWDKISTIVQGVSALAIFLLTWATLRHSATVAEANVLMAKSNGEMVEEMEIARHEHSRPHVAVFASSERKVDDPKSRTYYLVVKNDSSGAAYAVRFDSGDLTMNSHFEDDGFDQGLTYLSPDSQVMIRAKMNIMSKYWDVPRNVYVEWYNKENKEFSETYVINFQQQYYGKQIIFIGSTAT